MARRNDHTREEITEMALAAGLKMIEDGSLANMSLRKVANAIEYTPGTIQNIFGSYTQLVLRINALTLHKLQQYLQDQVEAVIPNPAKRPKKALIALTNAYIDFAVNNLNCWQALFDFSSPQGTVLSTEHYHLIQKMLSYVNTILLPLCHNHEQIASQHTKVIWASVHGICQLGLSNKLDLVGIKSTHELAQLFLINYLKGLK